jgi:hypothetical protein
VGADYCYKQTSISCTREEDLGFSIQYDYDVVIII